MNRRIAKKIVAAKKHVHTWDRTVRAHKILGLEPPTAMYVIGVDKGEEGGDFTGVHIVTEWTSSFHYRTGKAPVHLDGALVPAKTEDEV